MKRLAVLLLSVSVVVFATAQVQQTPEQTFDTAMRALQAGNYAQAEHGFRDILRKEPDNPAALANLGVLYSKTHRYTEAIDEYMHALRGAPSLEPIQLNLGLAYLKQNDYVQALPMFTRLHAAHPENAQFTILAATCLSYLGKAEEAIALLEPLAADGHDRAALYMLGVAYTRANQPDKAKQALSGVFAGAPPAQASFLMGEAYADATDYPSAVTEFKAVLASDPNFPGARRELGRTYLGMHQNAEAFHELRLAVEADPADSAALYAWGALLAQQSRFAEAKPILEQAQKAAPDSWATAFYLGKADYELHNTEAAEKQLRRAVELNPDEPGAPYLLARMLRAQGHTEEANRWMQRVSALHATALDAEQRALGTANQESIQPASPAP